LIDQKHTRDAVEAARQWRYAIPQATKVDTAVNVEINFNLKQEEIDRKPPYRWQQLSEDASSCRCVVVSVHRKSEASHLEVEDPSLLPRIFDNET